MPVKIYLSKIRFKSRTKTRCDADLTLLRPLKLDLPFDYHRARRLGKYVQYPPTHHSTSAADPSPVASTTSHTIGAKMVRRAGLLGQNWPQR